MQISRLKYYRIKYKNRQLRKKTIFNFAEKKNCGILF